MGASLLALAKSIYYKVFAANGHCTLIKNKYKIQSRDL